MEVQYLGPRCAQPSNHRPPSCFPTQHLNPRSMRIYLCSPRTNLRNIWVCSTVAVCRFCSGPPCCHHRVASSPLHNLEKAVLYDQPSFKPAISFISRLLESPFSQHAIFCAVKSTQLCFPFSRNFLQAKLQLYQ